MIKELSSKAMLIVGFGSFRAILSHASPEPCVGWALRPHLDPKVCKVIARSHPKQPTWPSFYILLGSR